MNVKAFLTRRSLIAGAAAEATCLGAAGMSATAARADEAPGPESPQLPSFLRAPEPIGDDQISQTYEADVVAVGMGVAGVAAARTAAESGLKVVSIERSSDVNARSGQVACFNCDAARKMGIEDIDATELVNELMIQMGHRPDARVLKNWADNAGETFDWFVSADPDVIWAYPGSDVQLPGLNEATDNIYVAKSVVATYVPGADHERLFTGTLSLRPGLLPMTKLNRDAAVATGNLTDIYDMRALQLTKDGDRVSGVIAQSIADGSYIKATASKTVILATGDYLNNDEMLAYYMPWIYWQKDKFVFTYMSVDMNVDKVDVDDETAANMVREVSRYNELCTKGHDDFGKAPERMMALDIPPFYAIRYALGNFGEGQNALRCLVGMSGLSTNKYAQVLNDNFDPLPGLFAVGNVQGGRFLGDYPATLAASATRSP